MAAGGGAQGQELHGWSGAACCAAYLTGALGARRPCRFGEIEGARESPKVKHAALAVLRYVGAADGCNHAVDRGNLRRHTGHAPAQPASSNCSSRTAWKVVRPTQPLLGPAAPR